MSESDRFRQHADEALPWVAQAKTEEEIHLHDGTGGNRLEALIAFPLRAIAGLADVQDSGSAGGEARGGGGLGLLTITTRERRGLR